MEIKYKNIPIDIITVVDTKLALDICRIANIPNDDAYRFGQDGRPFVSVICFHKNGQFSIDFFYRCGKIAPGDFGKISYPENEIVLTYDDITDSVIKLGEQVNPATFMRILSSLDYSKMYVRGK